MIDFNDVTVSGAGIPGTAGAYSANAGAFAQGVHAVDPTTIGAAVGGSGTKISGRAISRVDAKMPLSAQLVLIVKATLASGNTLSLVPEIKTGPTSSPSTALGTAIPAQVLTANDDGTAIQTALRVNVDLDGADEYVQFNVTPTLSASGSDVAKIAGVAVLLASEQLISPGRRS